MSHCPARGRGVAGFDRRQNCAMFPLDHFEISALAFALMDCDADALAGDDEAAEIVEKAQELQVVGCGGDGAVKREVFVDRGFTALDRGVDR